MTTATCTFLLIAFGVAIASEDQLTNGKHIYPNYIIKLWIHLG